MPDAVKKLFRRGFKVALSVPESWAGLMSQAVEASQANIDEDAVAKQLGVSPKEARWAIGALGLVAAAIAERNDAPEAVVKVLVSAGVLDAEDEAQALELASVAASHREQLASEFERVRLGFQVLPSFRFVSTTTDIRVGFKGDEVSNTVPVAIILIRTDAESQEIWFQANEAQLAHLVSTLERSLRRLREAESWSSKLPTRER